MLVNAEGYVTLITEVSAIPPSMLLKESDCLSSKELKLPVETDATLESNYSKEGVGQMIADSKHLRSHTWFQNGNGVFHHVVPTWKKDSKSLGMENAYKCGWLLFHIPNMKQYRLQVSFL
jgi:hypothetical protein